MTNIDQIKERYELILNAAGEGIYGLDKNGKVTFVNPAAVEITGWSVEDTIGEAGHEQHHHSRADGNLYPREECPIYAALKDGEVHHQVRDEVFWRKDGTSFPVYYSSTPIIDDGEIIGAVVVFQDVTEIKQSETKLKKALEEISQLKERIEAENTYLQEEIKHNSNFEEILGQSPKLKKVFHQVEQVAPTDTTVLLLGETGTGKELFARSVHNLSQRKERPLVKVNCTALPINLIESELFGHEKGSFTGAISRRIGRFELADGGTIFLDEIGELSLDLQVKLLRVVQEGEFERLGGTTTISVDVRIIAATHRDLKAMVAKGDFREDLFYRLNVFPITLPPLRERGKDIAIVVQSFVTKFSQKMAKQIDIIPQAVMDELSNYSWPGNVRELENIIERAVILSNNNVLKLQDRLTDRSSVNVQANLKTFSEMEKDYIIKVLEHTDWRISGEHGAASILEMHPNTLRSRMSKLGIRRSTSAA
ncbi:MAG: sigma 54-interacting transcriptional regulator [Piscirickettsiaceae bacterium]|nr:sigma 54-interacting transcriptional regulator [Piscirickettsiaceae bacterium]